MYSKKLFEDLTVIIDGLSLDSKLKMPKEAIATYLIDSLTSLAKIIKVRPEASIEDDFVDRMYAMYPPKCPKRGAMLGKSHKDKERIKKLLKIYTMDQIEAVFKREIEEKYDKQYMQNFSTFLNNFPDPNAVEQDLFVVGDIASDSTTEQKLIIGGVEYR